MKRGIIIDSWDIPIYNAVKAYTDSSPVPFHMPGHKLGRGIPGEFLRDIAALDLTEIPGTDNLHHPAGAIRDAQELAAKAFGADRTYFLVNGSTCGIHAMISTMCRPGDSLIVARDCHISVISGMMLAGVRPIYILPEFNADFGIASGIMPERVDEALRLNPDAVGILLTRPSYYGICSDIERISGIVHSHGKILAVDEAHGSHLRFENRLPLCAMDAGADMCVQSAHKTLPAFTQGAYLHVKSSRIDIERLEGYLGMFQTSSPSYIIMTFLDIAREIMQREGRSILHSLLDAIYSKKELENYQRLAVLDDNNSGEFRTDATRITINFKKLGITGYKAEEILRRDFNIQVEMSDIHNIVCIATIADLTENIAWLFSCLHELENMFEGNKPFPELVCPRLKIPVQQLGLAEVMQAKTGKVELTAAAGRISRNIIAPYPPGIPVVCPGEVISPEICSYLSELIGSGANVNGVDENMRVVVV